MGARVSISEIATVTLSVCAVALTSLVAKREFFPPKRVAAQAELTTSPIDDWPAVMATGHRSGSEVAKVTLVVFDDYECPACQYLETVTLPGITKEFSGQLAIVRRHAPLPYHRFAYPAARAAECAAAQGSFDAMHALLFLKQDSLGIKPFRAYAEEIGVRDLVAFDACNARAGSISAVEADFQAAKDVGMVGTPTVIVNGQLFNQTPDSAGLSKTIRSELGKAER